MVGLVVHHGHLEAVLPSLLLHLRIAVIDKRLSISIPVHDESADPHLLCGFDLPFNLLGILRRIANRDVPRMTKPRFIQGDHLRRSPRRSVL